MDERIIDLKSTTFSGRRLNRQQIAAVQETVELLPHVSRNELAKTICEHVGWKTAKGAYKVGACLGMLETLESPRHPQAAAEAGGQRPRHEGRPGAGVDVGLGPATRDRGGAVRPGPASCRARPRRRGAASRRPERKR